MEEQDKLIMTSLNQMGFKIPGSVKEVKDMDGDSLQSLCVQFLKKLGFDSKPIESQQKFRIATKIQEDLKKEGGIRVDLNVLMSPTIQDLRRILISVISRLSMSENTGEEHVKAESYQEKVHRQKLEIKQHTITSWLREEWIHPCLFDFKENNKKFRTYDTNVALDSKNVQKVLTIDNFDAEIKANMFASLGRVIDLAKQKALEADKNEEKFYKNQAQRSEALNAQRAEQHKVQLKDMVRKNASEWKNLKKKKIVKLARQMKTENAANNEQQQQQENGENDQTAEKTLFRLEQEFQTNENKEQVDENNQEDKEDKFDLEGLKKKHEEEISELKQQIDTAVGKLQKFDDKRTKMEENLTTKSEEVENYKEANKQLQINVEQLHLLLQQYQSTGGTEQLISEVKRLEQEIIDIENEWVKIRDEMQTSIGEQRNQVREKKEKIDQQREKAKRLENDYVSIIQDIRNAYDQREALKAECERLPQEIYGRQKYVRSITEIMKNFNKQKDEIKKIIDDVEKQNQIIRGHETTLSRFYIEFENSFNTDPKKKESLHIQIFKIYEEYREIFQKTVQTLSDSAVKKIEIREMEAKVDQISSKGFKNSVEKLRKDLEDIKLENQQFQQHLELQRMYYQQQQQEQKQQQNQQYQQQNDQYQQQQVNQQYQDQQQYNSQNQSQQSYKQY